MSRGERIVFEADRESVSDRIDLLLCRIRRRRRKAHQHDHAWYETILDSVPPLPVETFSSITEQAPGKTPLPSRSQYGKKWTTGMAFISNTASTLGNHPGISEFIS